MANKGKRTTKGKAKAAAPRRATRPAASPATDDGLRPLLRDLALLSAANNLMAQTAFLSLERMRITTELTDERVDAAAAQQLWERCEKLVQASDDVILRLLDAAEAQDERADLVRGLVQMRRDFSTRTRKPMEQPRLVESMERMYR